MTVYQAIRVCRIFKAVLINNSNYSEKELEFQMFDFKTLLTK